MKAVLPGLVLVLVLSPNLHAAQSASVVGSGARAMGMGGAFIAVADDATAISWNPAGLTRLDAPEIGIAATFGSGSWDLSLDPYLAQFYSTDVEVESKLSLNFASVVYPFALGEKHAVAALAFRKYWDYTEKTTLTNEYFLDVPVDLDNDGLADAYYDYEDIVNDQTGAVNAITPAVAIQLSPMFSLGATASIIIGGVDLTQEYSTTYYDDFGATLPFSEKSTGSAGFKGFTAELGLLADISPQFRVGLVGSIPWTLTWTDEEFDGEELADEEQDIPVLFGIGVAGKPMPALTLALDVRHQPWSKMKLNDQDWDAEDATVIRGGAEYLLIGQSAIIPLRAGYYIEPTMDRADYYDPETDELIEGDQIKNKGLTFGVGLIMGRFTLDACYAHVTRTYDDDLGENSFSENSFTISTVVHLGPGSE